MTPRRPGSYGRFAWVLVPAWVLAVAALLDLAARLGGAARWVAWSGVLVVGVGAVAFAAVLWASRRGP